MSTPESPFAGGPSQPSPSLDGWVAPGSTAPEPASAAPSSPSPWATPSTWGSPMSAPGAPATSPYSAPSTSPSAAPGANPYGAPPGASADLVPPASPSPGSQPAQAQAGNASNQGRYWNTFKPGIVTLRPMSLGDVFGGAFGLLRFNPKGSIGLTAVVVALGVALSIPLTLLFSRGMGQAFGQQGAQVGLLSGALLLQGLPGTLTGFLVTPLMTRTVYEAIIGNPASIGSIWEKGRSRILPYIGASILIGLLGLVPAVLAVLLVVASNGIDEAFIALGFVGLFFATAVGAVIFSIKLFAFPAAIVLEGSGPWASLRRSWTLTSGSFWRILGYLLLAGITTAVIGGVIQAPLALILGTLGTGWEDSVETQLLIQTLSSVIGQLLALLITVPFSTAFTTLLWADLRIRREGFDLTLIEQSAAVEQNAQPTTEAW